MDFIEPCFGIGHNLSLICQMTSEDIKHQLIIIISTMATLVSMSTSTVHFYTALGSLHWEPSCRCLHSAGFSILGTFISVSTQRGLLYTGNLHVGVYTVLGSLHWEPSCCCVHSAGFSTLVTFMSLYTQCWVLYTGNLHVAVQHLTSTQRWGFCMSLSPEARQGLELTATLCKARA